MIEQQIENIKNALREMIQLITQRGEPLSEELKLKIAQVMEHTANRIQELREAQRQEDITTISPTQTPPTDIPIEPAPIESSNINGFNYDPKSGKLLVRFQEGNIYSYENVPKVIFRIFQSGAISAKTNGKNRFGRWWVGKTPSLGAAFYELIRNGGYPYQRLQ